MTNEVQKAMQTVIEALQNDPEYAWSWHCNIAMAFVDAGGDNYTGNHGAARFMKLLANVEPAHALPTSQAPTQEPEQPAKRHGYKEAYIEAMVASNEAGFVGLSAAETIRALAHVLDKRAEQPAQQIVESPDDWSDWKVTPPQPQPAQQQQEPDELLHIGEQDCLLDVDEKAWRSLVENRGGCSCYISPPCGACSNPISEEEMNEVGYTYAFPQPAQPRQEPDLSEQGRTLSAILGNNVEAMMDAGLPFLTALETTLKVYDHDTPKIGCVNHDCDQCKAQRKPLTDEQKKELFKEWANARGVWPRLTHQEIFYAGIEAAHEITNE